MTPDEQLEKWLAGNPVHNTELDECCPDFSCCNGKIMPIEIRKRFVKAYYENDENTKMQMLMMFLGNAFADKNVYIAGDDIGSCGNC